MCEKARSEAVAGPERAGAPAVSSAFMGLADVITVAPFNSEVPQLYSLGCAIHVTIKFFPDQYCANLFLTGKIGLV